MYAIDLWYKGLQINVKCQKITFLACKMHARCLMASSRGKNGSKQHFYGFNYVTVIFVVYCSGEVSSSLKGGLQAYL